MLIVLIPLIGVGEFNFGDIIAKVTSRYSYEFIPKQSKHENDLYLIEEPEMSFGVNENNLIENISCSEECIYKGRNIIGMTIAEFISHTGERYYGEVDVADFEEDNIPQYVYEFDDIGLQVWEKGKGGKIVTVIASPPYEEETK